MTSPHVAADTIVSADVAGIVNTITQNITITTGVTVYGLNDGLNNLGAGNIGTLINNGGTITGTHAAIRNGNSLSGNSPGGTIGTLTNNGFIDTSNIGIMNEGPGTIGTLNNNVRIYGTTYGINNAGTISSLVNTGTITSNLQAIYNTGIIATINNSGRISNANTAIFNDSAGTISAIVNSGLISGNSVGINNSGGTIGALTNTGTITGSSFAISTGNTGSLGPIANAGLIAGSISSGSGNNLTISGGSGTIFGTLTGISGGIGSADIGQITNTSSNLVFSSGNQLLNDRINVGSNTVINAGSMLQINNRVSISGNFAQSAGGTLMFGVASAPVTASIGDTGYGRLVVTGNATLASGSTVGLKPLSFAFAQGQRYAVLAATGTLTASGVNYSAAGFNVTGALQQDTANNIFTDLILTLGSASGGGSGNAPANNATNGDAKAALSGLFNYSGNDARMLAIFNPAAALGSSAEANRAGAQLNPAATGTSLSQSVQVSTQAVIDVTTAHIDAVRLAQASGSGSGIATGERPNDVAVWGQAFYGQANQNDRTGASGYKAGYNGTLIGVDTAVGDQWRAGGLFSYANTSMANTGDNTGSSGHVTSYGVTGYAGYAGDAWYLDLSAGVAAQKYNTLRAVNFTGFSGSASGSFDGMQYIASAQAGYPIKLDTATTLTPIGGLTYGRLHQDGYTETGSAALQIGSASTTSIKSDLGAKLERVFKTSYGDLTPSAQLSWRHEYRDTGLRSVASFAADTTGSTSFVSQAVAPEKDTGVLVLGVTLARSQNLTLSGHYTLEAAGGYTAQTADVRLRYAF